MVRKYTIGLPVKNLCLILALLFITCCVTPPPMLDEPIKRYWEVEVPLEVAWKASVQALVEKGVIISILDKENSLMVLEETLEGGAFQRVTAERGFFYSGLARVTLLFTEKPEEKTGININSALQGFTGRYYLYVTSNGNLEKDYFLLISNNLPIKRTYKWLEEDEEGDKEEVKGEGAEEEKVEENVKSVDDPKTE